MDNLERRILQGLLLAAVVLAGLLAVGHERIGRGFGETGEPFIKDRVVKVRIVMDEKAWQRIRANPWAKEYERADFWFDGRRYRNVAIRAKGSSSLMSVAGSRTARISFKVDFNFFNFAQTFRGLKKLCLNNGFSDPTLIRETLGYEAFESMGLPTPRTAFVDLYVNDEHIGLYTQVEVIDKTFLRRHFSNPNGNLYKPEIGAATLNWTRADAEQQAQRTRTATKNTLAINIGGSRLSDLLRLMQREDPSYDANEAAADMWGRGGPGGGFPGGPGGQGGGLPGGPAGGFAGGPGGGFGPGGPFPVDANNPRMQGGGFGFAGPGGSLPMDSNDPRMQAGGFGFPSGGPVPGDPNDPRARGGFGPGGFAGPFPMDPNDPRARGGFEPGGPGGPFPMDANDPRMRAGGFGFERGGRGGPFGGDPNDMRARGRRGSGFGPGGGGFGGPGGGFGGPGEGLGGTGGGGRGGPFDQYGVMPSIRRTLRACSWSDQPSRGPAIGAACGLLPFGLGRHAFARSQGISHGVEPRDIGNGVGLAAGHAAGETHQDTCGHCHV